MNPGHIFKRLFELQNIDNPKLKLQLNHFLHPTLDPAAQFLEMSIVRLQSSTETLLSRHGVQIMEKQVDIQRLAECAIALYAMFASVSRASRSYCIGLQHADYEVSIANALAYDCMQLIKYHAFDIRDGQFHTTDFNHQKLGKHLFYSKCYFPVNPLTRNF